MTGAGHLWYVAFTQPNNEGRAEVNLRRQGFTTYLPRYLRTRRHARKTETVAQPLFPRYLFVRFDVTRDRWRSVSSTNGISHLITAGEAPVPISEEIIGAISAREDGAGFVRLGLPAGVGPGSSVRLVDSIFADAVGVIERVADDRRIAVLLSLLGRQVRVFVSPASIRAG
jgi:transcriptional antiterminator RfaH